MIARVDIVLVGTANGENVGAAARLADNFGVAGLTLVAPRVRPDDARAQVVGRAARQRLASLRLAATLDEALAGAAYAVGFSARRGADRPTVGLHQLGARLAARAPAGRVALVFGPEDSGLSGADVDRCDLVATIETPGPLASLNLAQAVAVALYELSRPAASPANAMVPPADATEPPGARGGAPRAELEAVVAEAVALLASVTALGDDELARRRILLRRVLAAAALRPDELRAVHGVLAQLARRR